MTALGWARAALPRAGRSWVARCCFGVLIGTALLVGMVVAAAPASAHTELESSDPAEGAVLEEAPGVARLTFNEPVRPAGDAVPLLDATGTEWEAPSRAVGAVVEIDLPDDLADGSYVVSWRVISADGDPVSGALTFAVGEPSDSVVPPDVAGSTAKWLLSAVQGATYLALFVAAGLAMFWFWVLGGIPPELHERLLPVAGPAAVLAVLGALVQVPLTALYQQGLGVSNLFDVGSWSDVVGRDELVASALVVVGSLLGAEYLRGRNAVGSLAGFFLAAVGLAFVGHTRSSGTTGVMVASDLVHLCAGAAWVGGLFGLVLTLHRLDPSRGAEVLARFSMIAGGLVALVAASGSLMAWRILRSWDGIVDSPFGRLLVVKVAIVLVVLAVATMNRFWLLPRFVQGGGDSDLLRRTVRLEAAGLIAVLLLTGFLVERSPVGDGPRSVRTASTVPVGSNDLMPEFENPA
ncbi:MAG TPA: copper resistance protein CopC [Nocardioidaceae bacterium]|nr:copper resistance protein CopC [Nocardioidaceae bacterium]